MAVLAILALGSVQLPAVAATKAASTCVSAKTGLNPKLPATFEELLAKRKCISFAAWNNFSSQAEVIEEEPTVKILIGPNTKPFYSKPAIAVKAVTGSFPNSIYSAETVYIYYNFKDSAWANKTFRSLISGREYENISRNQGGRIIENGCETVAKTCFGSQAITTESGKGIVLLGVPNVLSGNDPTSTYRFKTGMLEAHEYFHLLQDAALFGETYGAQTWPPRWILEGGAEYIQNAVIHKKSFKKYLDYRFLGASDLYRNKATYTEKYLMEYLSASVSADGGSKYDPWLSYNLGSRFIEILVALKGQESLIELNDALGETMNFAKAFESTYGVAWKNAVPLLAKVVATDLAQGL